MPRSKGKSTPIKPEQDFSEYVQEKDVSTSVEETLNECYSVSKSILSDSQWEHLIQDFVQKLTGHNLLHSNLIEEFLYYLKEEANLESYPPFLVELAHFEWIDFDLKTAEIHFEYDKSGDCLNDIPIISPLAELLIYNYPVHKIEKEISQMKLDETPTYIIAWRDTLGIVRFMTTNDMTARLFEILKENAELTGRQALETIADEIQINDTQELIEHGLNMLNTLHEHQIIIGTSKKN